MNLKVCMRSALEELQSQQPAARRLYVKAEQGILSADVAESDRMSCALRNTALVVPALHGLDGRRLRTAADWVRRQAKALWEPLTVLEVDESAGVALLRSSDPRRDGPEAVYFEVTLNRSGEISLRRFRKTSGDAPREEIACLFTHEQLLRLVDDWTQRPDFPSRRTTSPEAA